MEKAIFAPLIVLFNGSPFPLTNTLERTTLNEMSSSSSELINRCSVVDTKLLVVLPQLADDGEGVATSFIVSSTPAELRDEVDGIALPLVPDVVGSG